MKANYVLTVLNSLRHVATNKKPAQVFVHAYGYKKAHTYHTIESACAIKEYLNTMNYDTLMIYVLGKRNFLSDELLMV